MRTAYSRNAIDAGVNVDPTILSVSAAAESSTALLREECLEHGVAQPNVGHDAGSEDFGRDDDDLARLGHPGGEVGTLPSDQADLAEEPASAVPSDDPTVDAEDLD